MTVFDVHSNFGYATVTTAPSPAGSGTTLVLGTATFADFPDPGTIGYNVVVWPAVTIPLSSNSEILRVVTKGTNGTVEVTREQESTSARDITVGDQCGVAITKKVITDIETAVPTQATGAEVNTGTEDAKIVTPKALADSDYVTLNDINKKAVVIQVFDGASDVETGDGKAYFTIPSYLNGFILKAVHARVVTAGTTNTTDIQIANVTDSVDMLSTKLTIDSGETGSDTGTAAVIDATKDDVATNDLLRIDVDATSTTKAKGLIVRLEFEDN